MDSFLCLTEKTGEGNRLLIPIEDGDGAIQNNENGKFKVKTLNSTTKTIVQYFCAHKNMKVSLTKMALMKMVLMKMAQMKMVLTKMDLIKMQLATCFL